MKPITFMEKQRAQEKQMKINFIISLVVGGIMFYSALFTISIFS